MSKLLQLTLRFDSQPIDLGHELPAVRFPDTVGNTTALTATQGELWSRQAPDVPKVFPFDTSAGNPPQSAALGSGEVAGKQS